MIGLVVLTDNALGGIVWFAQERTGIKVPVLIIHSTAANQRCFILQP